MRAALGMFKWSLLATVAALAVAFVYDGLRAVALVGVLVALEASISFDNAVVNATVLRRLSSQWQRAFLTIGIVIAVFGMRVVFPIAVVAVATELGFVEVVDQALNDKDAYASSVEGASAMLGAFGGAFLAMVSLTFLLDPEREVHWIGPVERRLATAGRLTGLPVVLAAVAVAALWQLVPAEDQREVLVAGALGIVVFLVVRGASQALERRQGGGEATGAAGLAGFLYLEMLDASFSLDGVLGAFAISKDIVIIALGLGVGAIFVRSLTVYLVRRQSLRHYRYLKHGAHWAILALAVILFVTTEHHVPEGLTAAVSLGTIGAAVTSSVLHNRRS